MPKQRKSKNQLEKQRDQSRQRNEEFFIKKDMERDSKDAMARQAALEKLGIFSFEDHDAIYSYADYSAPLQMIDASVAPPAVTEYPEYPRSEFSTPPAFNVAVKRNKQSAHDTLLHATASRDALRFRRAQHLFAKISTAISGQPCL